MATTDDDASVITAKLASTSIGDGAGERGANGKGTDHTHGNANRNGSGNENGHSLHNGLAHGNEAQQPFSQHAPRDALPAEASSDKYYKAFLIKLFEFGRAAESGVDVVDKWEAVRALDPIAISQSLRAQAQKKPGEAQALSGQEVVSQPAVGQSGAADGYKRDVNGNVIGPLAGLPASRSGTRREVPPAVVNGKPLASATAGANGHIAPYPHPNGIAPTGANESTHATTTTTSTPSNGVLATSQPQSHVPTPTQFTQAAARPPARPTSPNGSSSKGPLWGQDLSLSPDRLALWRAHVACMPPSCPSYTFTLPGISFPTHDTTQIQKAQDWMERLRVRVNDMRNIFTSKRAMHLLTLVGGDEADARNCLGLTTTKGDKVLLETRQVLIHGRMALLSLGKEGNVDEHGSVRVDLWRGVLEFDKKGRLIHGAAGSADGKEVDANGHAAGNGAGNGSGNAAGYGHGRVFQRCDERAGRSGDDPDAKVNCSVGIMRIQGGHPIVFSLHHFTLKARAYPVSGNRDEEAKAVKALRYLVDNGKCCADCEAGKEWSFEVTPLWIPERPEDGHTLTTHILQNIIVQTATHMSGLDPKAYGLTKENRTLPSRQAAWLAWQQTGLRVANFEALKRESDRLGILST